MRLALAAATAALLGSAPAGAYVRTISEMGAQARWDCPAVSLLVYSGGPPSGMTGDQVGAAMKAAAAAWTAPNVACTGLRLSLVTVDSASAPALNDAANRIVFRRERWCHEPQADDEPCYAPSALAITTVTMRTRDGVILDTDMELNATADVLWSDLVDGGPPRGAAHDLQNTLTHELGHVLGFDHTCWADPRRPRLIDHKGVPTPLCGGAPREVQATTMFVSSSPGDIEKRTLEADDRQAVCDVYPAGGGCLQEGDEGGGCAVAPHGRGGALVTLMGAMAGAALMLRRSVRRRCRPHSASGCTSSQPPSNQP